MDPDSVRTASGPWAAVIRTIAFLRKELVSVLRQPALVVTLVLGPFLILGLFGAGLQERAPIVSAVFVAPEGSEAAEQAQRFADAGEIPRLIVEDVTADLDGAVERVREGELDLVVRFPEGVDEALRNNLRPPIVFYHDYLDPIETQALIASMRTAVDEVNQLVARSLVEEAQADVRDLEGRVTTVADRVTATRQAIDRGDQEAAQRQLELLRGELAGLDTDGGGVDDAAVEGLEVVEEAGEDGLGAAAEQVEELAGQEDLDDEDAQALSGLATQLRELETDLEAFGSVPPGLFVSRFRGLAERVTDDAVDLTDFYAPAVLVLLAQHLAVTFVGLSVVRDEQLGITELFRVSPLSAAELMTGKALAHLLLTGGVTALVTGLMVVVLGVPMLGSWPLLAVVVVAALVASIGIGLLIAMVSRGASQAVQYTMLLLLANVFFSGFLLSLDRFREFARIVPWSLPATYAIALLRDVMLRGRAPDVRLLGVLAAVAVVLLGVSWVLVRRRMLRAHA